MVCDRCIMIVKQQLESFGLIVKEISLGRVDVEPEKQMKQLLALADSLAALGFELIDKEKDQLVEQIKNQVIELVHYTPLYNLQHNLTQVIANSLNKDFAYLSRQFSESEGLTIERYIIQQKIEKVKELIEYGELNLNEIAYQMGYSSSAHLSTQFKSVTGFTPSKYKSFEFNNRKSLDKVK